MTLRSHRWLLPSVYPIPFFSLRILKSLGLLFDQRMVLRTVQYVLRKMKRRDA